MTQVTLEANSETKPHTVDTATGRVIGLRKLNKFDHLKLAECVGAENAKNEPYMLFATVVWHVVSINGETIIRPTNKLQFEVLMKRLDDDGFDAVVPAIPGLYPDTEGAEERLKNASGTPASPADSTL